MIEILKLVISDSLTALYQPFWFAVILSALFMFVWMQYSSLRAALKQWLFWYRTSKEFRKMFVLVFYTVMILFRTLLNRTMWANPVSNVIGIWGLYKQSDGEKVLTTEVLENLALFIPFSFFLLWNYQDKLLSNDLRFSKFIFLSVKVTFGFSFVIEMLQLFLRLGTWQLSDLFYNTLGGAIGGVIYYLFVVNRNKE